MPEQLNISGTTLAGADWQAVNRDVQATPSVQGRERALSDLCTAIRTAFESSPPGEALSRIASIWESLDNAVELAEARSRILLRRVDPPPMSPPPSWLTEQVAKLPNEGAEGFVTQPAVLNTAEQLVCCSLHLLEMSKLTADLSSGPMGYVVVDWQTPQGKLQWMVAPTPLPWPGIKVYVLARRGSGSDAQRQTRLFYNAFDLIDHAKEYLRS